MVVYEFLLSVLTCSVVIPTYSSVGALQQMAGPVVIKVNPGETQNFRWSLFSDKNHTETVYISANGDGAEFLSFPKLVNLTANEVVNVPVIVNIPSNYNGNSTLTPKIRASEIGENNTNGGSTINIEMAKVVSLIVDHKINKTS
ncbi:MAG TPA: hypothetical protein VF884_06155 [Nitrososphaeraceae archaeon]